MQQLIDLLNFLIPYGIYSYWIMFGLLIACGFGLPMPEDIVLITGGILASRGICEFWIVHATCMAGVMIGDGTIFFIGRHFGPSIKSKRFYKRILNKKNDSRVKLFFSKYGDKVIFMARFMPGLRMPLFITAGIYGVSPIKFFALDGLAAIISVPAWIYVGYIFGTNLELLESKIQQFQFGIYGVLAIAILLGVIFYYTKNRVIKKQLS